MSGGDPRAYTAVLRDGRTVGWYMDMLPLAGEEQDYMSVTVLGEDTASARVLAQRGFCFTDRAIPLVIPLRRFRLPLDPGKRFRLVVKDDWDPEEVYTVACGSFDTDVRFALDMEQRDRAMKNELLCGYIDGLRQEGTMATCLYSSDGLEGFNLWTLHGDAGRVVLGAMSERYRGTGVALSLYSQTAVTMKEAGAAVLRDIVACSNAASLNLHAMLIRCAGGVFRFGPCQDNYKKERSVSGMNRMDREKDR